MANKVYNEAKNQLLRAGINFLSDTFKLTLVMSNTTAGTEVNQNLMTGFTTLDECDAAGYPAGGVALGTQSVNEDAGGNRAFFDAADVTFTALAAGSRQVAGMVLYKVTSPGANSFPVCFFDTPGFPFWGNGSNVVVQWATAGVCELA